MDLIRKLGLTFLLSGSMLYPSYSSEDTIDVGYTYNTKLNEWPEFSQEEKSPSLTNEDFLDFLDNVNRAYDQIRYFFKLGSIMNPDGRVVFNPYEVQAFVLNGVDLDYVLDYSMIKDLEGRNFFSAIDIINLNEKEVPAWYSANVVNVFYENNQDRNGIDEITDSRSIGRFYQLCADPNNLYGYDTEKPNVLIILPKYDWNLTFESFYSNRFYKFIMEEYDYFIRVINSDDDYFKIRDYCNSNGFHPDLNIITGHGSLESIQFGNPIKDLFTLDSKASLNLSDALSCNKEFYYLDLEDEPELCMDMVDNKPTDRYFLFSCSSFGHLLTDECIGNMFARNASKGEIIYGACDIIYNGGQSLKLRKEYPFDISIQEYGKILTVVHRPKLFGEIPLEKKKPINLNEYWNKRRFNRGCRYR